MFSIDTPTVRAQMTALARADAHYQLAQGNIDCPRTLEQNIVAEIENIIGPPPAM
jgi:hypothetical protein